MAKNFRRMLAMVLVMCMFVSALPMQALAVEDGTTTQDGLEITITTPSTDSGNSGSGSGDSGSSTTVVEKEVTVSGTSSSTGADVNMGGTLTETTTSSSTTTSVETNVDLEGEVKESDGTDKKVTYDETTTTTTTKEEDGSTSEKTVIEGSKTESWSEDLKAGEELSGVPSVDANAFIFVEAKNEDGTTKYETNEDGTAKLDDKGNPIPVLEILRDENGNPVLKKDDNGNIIISGSATGSSNTSTPVDNIPGGSTATNSSVTTTTKTDERIVTGYVVFNGESFVIVPDDSTLNSPVSPDVYEGKNYYDGVDAGEDYRYRDGLLTDKDKDYKVAVGEIPEKPTTEGYERGYDFVWSGHGDYTDGAVPVYIQDIVYQKNEDGSDKVDANGHKIIDMEKSIFVHARNSKALDNLGYDTGMVSSGGQFALKHINGEYFYAYCMDASTGAPKEGAWYQIRNLEDAVWSPENPDGYLTKEQAEKIRAIVESGYWGTDANEYEVNPDGTPVYATDENGNPLYETNKDGSFKLDENGQRIPLRVTKKDSEGNIITDNTVQGSLAKLKKELIAAYNPGDTVTLRYPGSNVEKEVPVYELLDDLTEEEALAVTQAAIWAYSNEGSMTYSYYKKIADAKDVDFDNCTYYQMVDEKWAEFVYEDLTLLSVLSARKYHNGKSSSPSWLDEYEPKKDYESDARMQALFDYLVGLSGISAEDGNDTTVIPDENVITSVGLVVGDKSKVDADGNPYAENLDNKTDNDVYNVDLTFTLSITPDPENDDLLVYLFEYETNEQGEIVSVPVCDADGNQVVRRLAGTDSEDRVGGNVITPDDNGVYTLTGLQLGENANHKLDIKIDGVQQLANGVYIYQAKGGREASQTLVGLAQGEQTVESHTYVSITFDVDEHRNVVAETKWYNDPTAKTTTPTPDTPVPTNLEPEAAPQVFRLANQNVEEIPEEPVPLAAPVITGDNSGLWIAVILLSVFAMAAINLFDKKRQQETF